jgi:hypothetical protein
LKINLNKSNVIVFRKGGPLRKNEKWILNGKPIDVVPYYKYLGIVFSSRLKWSQAVNTLAAQAQKSVGIIKTLYYKCNGLPIDVAFNLFDKIVVPILTYSAEVFSAEQIMFVYEKNH